VISDQAAVIKRLEKRLNLNSTNSNKPPSSDGPYRKPKDKTEKKKMTEKNKEPKQDQRKGQGVTRPQVPLSDCTSVTDLHPDQCACCHGADLKETGRPPIQHQVWELPEPVIEIHAYQLHASTCTRCHHVTRAEAPMGRSAFGARLTTHMSMLKTGYRMSECETGTRVPKITTN